MAALFGRNPSDERAGDQSALKKLLIVIDKEGGVGKTEIERFLNELGYFPSDEELDEKIEKFDGDGNGVLELNEFMFFLLEELQINDTEEEIVDAFKVFDKDGNGFINAVEVRRIMTNLGDKLTDDEVDIMIRKSDLDGDGQVNYEEFVKITLARIRQQEEGLKPK